MRWLFEYQCVDGMPYEVEIEAENLNKALILFGTYYHGIKAIAKIKQIK